MLACMRSIDLAQPLQPVTVEPSCRRLMILVWLERQPLAFVPVSLALHQREVSVDQLQAAILSALGGDLWQTVLGQQIEQQASQSPVLPPFSVVVCTRDRPESLARCLASLQHLDYPVYEVVVVDNASRDQATAVVVERAGVRYVYEPRPGLDWARNRGWNEATYDLIAYTDDDVVVDHGWLRGLAQSFADPEIAVTTGAILPLELETEAQLLFETYGGMHKGFKRMCFRRSDLPEAQMIAAHMTGVGANMAFRRAALAHVGGFDTALDVGTPSGGGGDLDMFHRIMVAGLPLCYEPRALVWHQHRRDQPGLRRQIENNGRSFGAYLLKIWQTETVPRGVTLRFAYVWIFRYLLPQVGRSLLRKSNLPFWLTLAELRGALDAPRAYRMTYAHDRQLRSGMKVAL